MFLRIYCEFVNKHLATYLATYELFDHESGDWERKKEKKEERKIERKEAFLFQVHSTKTSFTYFKANCTCWAESLVQKGKFNILDSNLFPLSFSEKYMLIKCFTLSNVMWSVAMGDRYERLVICILHGSRTCSITMLKTSSCQSIFWFCYQIDIDMEVWGPADIMFQHCCLNQSFLRFSEKRSSICSMSFHKQMTVYSLSKNLIYT